MNVTSICPSSSTPDVAFQGAWEAVPGVAAGSGGACPQLQGTSTEGSSMSFRFSGTQLFLSGLYTTNTTTADAAEPFFVYALDGATPSTGLMPPSADGTVQTFFTSPILAAGTHTLVLGVGFSDLDSGSDSESGSGSGSGAAFFLDEIRVVGGKDGGAQLFENGTSSGAGGGSGGVPVSAIAGGAAGGAILLIGALVAFYYLFWRRRHKREDDFEGVPVLHSAEDDEKWEVTPLILSQAPTGTAPVVVESAQTPEASVASRAASLVSVGSSTSAAFRVVNADTPPSSGKAAMARAESRTMLLQHRDSGMRFDEAGSNGAGPSTAVLVEDVPPVYSES